MDKKWKDFTEEDWQQYEYMIYRMQKAAEEVQKVFNCEPALEYDSTNGVTLFTELEEGSPASQQDHDKNYLSQFTVELLVELEIWNFEKEKDDEKKDVVTRVKEAKNIYTLKKIVKQEGEFKWLRNRLSEFNNAYDLKQEMYRAIVDSKNELKKKSQEAHQARENKRKYKSNRQKIVARALINLLDLEEPMTWKEIRDRIVAENQVLESGHALDPHLVERYVSSYVTFAEELGIIERDSKGRKYKHKFKKIGYVYKNQQNQDESISGSGDRNDSE